MSRIRRMKLGTSITARMGSFKIFRIGGSGVRVWYEETFRYFYNVKPDGYCEQAGIYHVPSDGTGTNPTPKSIVPLMEYANTDYTREFDNASVYEPSNPATSTALKLGIVFPRNSSVVSSNIVTENENGEMISVASGTYYLKVQPNTSYFQNRVRYAVKQKDGFMVQLPSVGIAFWRTYGMLSQESLERLKRGYWWNGYTWERQNGTSVERLKPYTWSPATWTSGQDPFSMWEVTNPDEWEVVS